MSKNKQKYNQIYEYLRADNLPNSAEPAIAFGRKDILVAKAIGDLAMKNLAEIVIISGGIGKDSGDIQEQGYRSEAHFIGSKLNDYASENKIVLPEIILEEKAANGGDNCRNSIEIFSSIDISLEALTAIAHSTSSRRLAEMLKLTTTDKTGEESYIYVKPTDYKFDPSNPSDQDEARAELLRFADWPAKGWLPEQSDLPENLVDFAREIQKRQNDQK